MIKGLVVSCGCYRAERIKIASWKGCGDLSGQTMASIKKRAEISKIEFNVTIEYLWSLFLKQSKKCALTDVELSLVSTRRRKPPNFTKTASLDRIDNTKGYIEGNVQWVHKNVNSMKWTMSQDEFISICRMVVRKFGIGELENLRISPMFGTYMNKYKEI